MYLEKVLFLLPLPFFYFFEQTVVAKKNFLGLDTGFLYEKESNKPNFSLENLSYKKDEKEKSLIFTEPPLLNIPLSLENQKSLFFTETPLLNIPPLSLENQLSLKNLFSKEKKKGLFDEKNLFNNSFLDGKKLLPDPALIEGLNDFAKFAFRFASENKPGAYLPDEIKNIWNTISRNFDPSNDNPFQWLQDYASSRTWTLFQTWAEKEGLKIPNPFAAKVLWNTIGNYATDSFFEWAGEKLKESEEIELPVIKKDAIPWKPAQDAFDKGEQVELGWMDVSVFPHTERGFVITTEGRGGLKMSYTKGPNDGDPLFGPWDAGFNDLYLDGERYGPFYCNMHHVPFEPSRGKHSVEVKFKAPNNKVYRYLEQAVYNTTNLVAPIKKNDYSQELGSTVWPSNLPSPNFEMDIKTLPGEKYLIEISQSLTSMSFEEQGEKKRVYPKFHINTKSGRMIYGPQDLFCEFTVVDASHVLKNRSNKILRRLENEDEELKMTVTLHDSNNLPFVDGMGKPISKNKNFELYQIFEGPNEHVSFTNIRNETRVTSTDKILSPSLETVSQDSWEPVIVPLFSSDQTLMTQSEAEIDSDKISESLEALDEPVATTPAWAIGIAIIFSLLVAALLTISIIFLIKKKQEKQAAQAVIFEDARVNEQIPSFETFAIKSMKQQDIIASAEYVSEQRFL